jgi:small ubiquitin-related modifier
MEGEESAPAALARPAEESVPAAAASVKVETISLVVIDQHGMEVQFKVRPTTRFSKIIDAYCTKKGVQSASIKFLYDGHRLSSDTTPEEVGMGTGLPEEIRFECTILRGPHAHPPRCAWVTLHGGRRTQSEMTRVLLATT